MQCVADGDEGGKHNLIKATVSDGKLWILKIQIGDKRWIFGKDKEAMLVFNSFTVSLATMPESQGHSFALYNLNILRSTQNLLPIIAVQSGCINGLFPSDPYTSINLF